MARIEMVVVICVLGMLAGIGMGAWEAFVDWSKGDLRHISSYVQLALAVMLPFAVGLVILVVVERRRR